VRSKPPESGPCSRFLPYKSARLGLPTRIARRAGSKADRTHLNNASTKRGRRLGCIGGTRSPAHHEASPVFSHCFEWPRTLISAKLRPHSSGGFVDPSLGRVALGGLVLNDNQRPGSTPAERERSALASGARRRQRSAQPREASMYRNNRKIVPTRRGILAAGSAAMPAQLASRARSPRTVLQGGISTRLLT
jgi:hypothetical protein